MNSADTQGARPKAYRWYDEADIAPMRQHGGRALTNEAANYRANF
jgi:hypothetical protein